MAKVNHEPIVLDVNHMMSDVVGFQYGIDADHVDGMAQAAAAAQHNVALNRGTGWLGWTELPYNQKEIVEKIETDENGETVIVTKVVADTNKNTPNASNGGSGTGDMIVVVAAVMAVSAAGAVILAKRRKEN